MDKKSRGTARSSQVFFPKGEDLAGLPEEEEEHAQRKRIITLERVGQRQSKKGSCPYLCGRWIEVNEGEGSRQIMEREEVSLHGERRPLGEAGDEITCQGSGEAEALREGGVDHN